MITDVLTFPRTSIVLRRSTLEVRLFDALAAEAAKRRYGRQRLTVANMLALAVVAFDPGKTIADHCGTRCLRGLGYHLPLLRERGYLIAVRSAARRHGRVEELFLTNAGKRVLEALEGSLSVCEPKADRFVKLA